MTSLNEEGDYDTNLNKNNIWNESLISKAPFQSKNSSLQSVYSTNSATQFKSELFEANKNNINTYNNYIGSAVQNEECFVSVLSENLSQLTLRPIETYPNYHLCWNDQKIRESSFKQSNNIQLQLEGKRPITAANNFPHRSRIFDNTFSNNSNSSFDTCGLTQAQNQNEYKCFNESNQIAKHQSSASHALNVTSYHHPIHLNSKKKSYLAFFLNHHLLLISFVLG